VFDGVVSAMIDDNGTVYIIFNITSMVCSRIIVKPRVITRAYVNAQQSWLIPYLAHARVHQHSLDFLKEYLRCIWLSGQPRRCCGENKTACWQTRLVSTQNAACLILYLR
jgi:hypothetical protein